MACRPIYIYIYIRDPVLITYNSLQASQPTYLRELFTIQPTRSTRSSSCHTLYRPRPVTSHLMFSTEPYPPMHHVFKMTYHLSSASFLYLHHRHCQSQDIHILYIRHPRVFHSKLKCHHFKHFYPDPSEHSPSPPERHLP